MPDERGDPTVDVRGTLPATEPRALIESRQTHPSASFVLPARYRHLSRIAGGAFGEVWRIHDTVLDRVLAMKVLRSEYVESNQMRARFLAEARITADLQHPGIVAVHDQGEFPDGRLWFTMKEVRGRTLRVVIEEVRAASGPDGFREAPSGWTFRRLVDAFARISQAVAYAHSRSVVHRDLKPENVMVGEFGEVLVMDWGLARRFDDGAESDREPSVDEPGPQLTRSGDVLGTPAYMPPEQARGQRELHGPASDVYALGAILYHLLSGRPPYDGTGFGVLRQVVGGAPEPLGEITRGGPPVPDELVAICERAMRREIADRYPDAEALAREVVAFLDGARRREQAIAVLDRARALDPEIAALRGNAARRRGEAQALLDEVQPFDPVEKKRPAWEIEDEAARLTRQAALAETAWLQTVHGALSLDPDLPEAHALLADHYRERLSAAEIVHRDEDAARFEALLRAHDRGRHAAFLRGEGALSLVTDPPGAAVRLERYQLRDRRLVAVDEGVIGETPLHEVPILRGSYRLVIRAPGRAEVRYPVLIERGGHWDGRAPGEAEPHPILLPREDEIGPGDVYVPAGWCWTGGDPDAADSLPSRRVWIDGFVIRRFPVTNEEYLAFLNDLVASGQAEAALAACPKSQLGIAAPQSLVFGLDPRGRFVPKEDELGRPYRPDVPVVLLHWFGAIAYATWFAGRTGRPWRLPNELEREKVARGADGRVCPWGDHFDPTFACVLDSHAKEPERASVESFPSDESPYGARGLAGNSRDWCINVWRREGPRTTDGRVEIDPAPVEDPDFRSVRGGAWSSVLGFSRAAVRFGNRPALCRTTIGVRLARTLSEPPIRARRPASG